MHIYIEIIKEEQLGQLIMNKVIFRFYRLTKNDFFEVSFDTRLSFYENFRLLKDIYHIEDSIHIYDGDKGIFLSMNVPLNTFNFAYYTKLYLINSID